MQKNPIRTRGTLMIASLLLSAIAAIAAEQPPAVPQARPVLWIEAKAEHAGLLNFAGTVQPRIETNLAFRTLGRVTARNVQVGDVVKQGDVLMELDPLALQFAVRSAQADLNSAIAQLQNARITEKRKDILAASNSISQADLEVAQQGLISAQASVDKAQSSLDKAQEQLGYAWLRADFDGAITATSGNVGQTVASGQTMLTLARLDQRDAVVDVPEALLDPIRATPEINVELQLDPTVTARGVLREIAPEADTTTRTHRLKIAIDNAPEAFRLGSVVTVRFSTEDGLEVIVLPSSAVMHKNDKDYVWLINSEGNTIRLAEVKTDPKTINSPLIRVLSGIARGDKIVAAGVNELQDGQTIRLGQERRT
ncbi:RND family efflux transporter MFP subunit [Agrobacterium vitis]|nr:RND family efflux transporter MFP subunit [Agrobacterium vitis]MBE1436393.1 RND family efflux transporter MFP subunit [Agrobacterium vitis]